MTQLGRIMNQRARDATKVADVVVFVTDVPVEKGEKGRPRKDGTPTARTRAPLTPHRGDVALLANIGAKLFPTLLVVNKVDRLRQKARLFPLLEALGKLRNFSSVIPISAQREDGVDARARRGSPLLLPEGEPRFAEDDLTDRPTRFFAAEYVREQILRATSEEVPHAAAVAVDRYVEPPAGTARDGLHRRHDPHRAARPEEGHHRRGRGDVEAHRHERAAAHRSARRRPRHVEAPGCVSRQGWHESTRSNSDELGYGTRSNGGCQRMTEMIATPAR